MAYFQGDKHVANFLKKALRDSPTDVDHAELLPVSVYLDALNKNRCVDEFGLALRNDASLLEQEKFWRWIRMEAFEGFPSRAEMDFTRAFRDALSRARGQSGLYSFWTDKEECLYVGTSVDLGQRPVTSFLERLNEYVGEIRLRLIFTETASDAAVLEMVAIATLKPPLNGSGKFKDALTLSIYLPSWQKPCVCIEAESRGG